MFQHFCELYDLLGIGSDNKEGLVRNELELSLTFRCDMNIKIKNPTFFFQKGTVTLTTSYVLYVHVFDADRTTLVPPECFSLPYVRLNIYISMDIKHIVVNVSAHQALNS